MNMLAELKFKKKSFIWRIRYISVNRWSLFLAYLLLRFWLPGGSLFGAFRFLVRFGCLFGNYAMELFPRNQRSPSADSALWFLSTVAPSLATATAYIPSRHRRSSPLSVLWKSVDCGALVNDFLQLDTMKLVHLLVHYKRSGGMLSHVGDYVGEQGGANYSAKFKNLEKLVKSLDTEILAKLHGSSKPFRSYILVNSVCSGC
ncbi:hypothetical protein JRO89_XS15G0157600 [Xanthoceras sorbifolium]|uniref:Uncharacterized protein n=1 Tax=Xanthoceras sorbifolium TaxID=99658 RepID=A0ABQ8H2D1_9ROSI|nr:hypothetical protein JRO89_XS15G0157600 [Xanthoceras sorbifolium]